MEVRWELAQKLRRLLEPEDGRNGYVEGIPNDHTELGRPECCIRFSDESLLDLEHPKLLFGRKLCHPAHCSEEFFSFANATDQWLRTVIGLRVPPPNEDIAGIIFQSNILPRDPHLSTPRATENGAYMSVYCPSRTLKEALRIHETLKEMLQRWIVSRVVSFDFGNHESGRCLDGNCENPSLTSELFSEIQAADVKPGRVLHAYGDGCAGIQLVTWRNGLFIKKIFRNSQSFDEERQVLERFSHPHLIYSFGKLLDQVGTSYFMEYMSNDLCQFIVEMDRVHGFNQPPFVTDATVDILLQVAKAMRHMHDENVDVVHCDLKSKNILISEIATPDAEKHYLVKVADFGSARLGSYKSKGHFVPGPGTTAYKAPEVLQQDGKDTPGVQYPHKIDVYSFGIVAFEVLTGIFIQPKVQGSCRKFKEGVMKGNLRPDLRAKCREGFIQDDKLLSLIEGCWHQSPSQRPSFDKICEKLEEARVRISIPRQTKPPRRQVLIRRILNICGRNRR